MAARATPPVDVLAGLPPRISDVVRPWAERSPDRVALVDSSGTWTYGQLAAAIAETRRWLLARAIRPGDRVMIVGENCRALVAVILAAAALDAWPVIVNARLSDREIDEIRDHSGARRVLYTPASPQARSHGVRHGTTMVDVVRLGPLGIAPLNEATEPEPVEADGGAQVAALIYTSGTTGRPKGVMLTHRNLLYVAAVAGMIRDVGQDDRIYPRLLGADIIQGGVLLTYARPAGSRIVDRPRHPVRAGARRRGPRPDHHRGAWCPARGRAAVRSDPASSDPKARALAVFCKSWHAVRGPVAGFRYVKAGGCQGKIFTNCRRLYLDESSPRTDALMGWGQGNSSQRL